MDFFKAFPIAIIDEDYEGKHAAGAACGSLPRPSRKRVLGLSPASVTQTHNDWSKSSTASLCWLVSVDGAEAGATQWQILEEVLAAKRRRNDRLPIFLFGDERTAEMVPASVLKHANAFMRLFEDLPEFLARSHCPVGESLP